MHVVHACCAGSHRVQVMQSLDQLRDGYHVQAALSVNAEARVGGILYARCDERVPCPLVESAPHAHEHIVILLMAYYLLNESPMLSCTGEGRKWGHPPSPPHVVHEYLGQGTDDIDFSKPVRAQSFYVQRANVSRAFPELAGLVHAASAAPPSSAPEACAHETPPPTVSSQTTKQLAHKRTSPIDAYTQLSEQLRAAAAAKMCFDPSVVMKHHGLRTALKSVKHHVTIFRGGSDGADSSGSVD